MGHFQKVLDLHDHIEKAASDITSALSSGKKLLICGNGGSAADAQHMSAELVGKFNDPNRKALRAIALTCNSSEITAIANDWNYDYVFVRQLEALADPGDVVLGISTSGNSASVLSAFEFAKKKGCTTIGLFGNDGGKARSVCDLSIIVTHTSTPLIQECHLMIEHIICDIVDRSEKWTPGI